MSWIQMMTDAHRSTDAAFLRQCAQHSMAAVRSAAASNVHTPAEVLAQLLKDEKPQIAMRVLKNPSCPPQLYVEALKHGDLHVRITAVLYYRAAPEVLLAYANLTEPFSFRLALAKCKAASEDLLCRLVHSPEAGIFEQILKHENCTPKVLQKALMSPHREKAQKLLHSSGQLI